MITPPLVSIIVPCYKQINYLNECLESVLNQTYINWECIVVNDGSPDDTYSVAQTWCIKDKRFKYIEIKNSGVSIARNVGIELATGEWILPLDADDKISIDYIRLAMESVKADDSLSVIYCHALKFGEENCYWDLPLFKFEDFLIKNQIFSSAFFRKNDWIAIGGFDKSMSTGREDWEFWINLISKTNQNVLCLDYIGFHYRIKKTSRNIDFLKMNENIIQTENYIYNKHQDLYTTQFGTFISLVKDNRQLQIRSLKLERIEKNIIYRILNKISQIFKKKV